jgi:hypothetical protein
MIRIPETGGATTPDLNWSNRLLARCNTVTAIGLLTCVLSMSTAAAEESLNCDVTLDSLITKQSVNRLKEEIEQIYNTDAEYIDDYGIHVQLCLNSPGGDLEAAKDLVAYFETLTGLTYNGASITTVVRSDASCLSACALIFMGGFDCDYFRLCRTSRIMESKARIGFHFPSLKVVGGGNARTLEGMYRSAIEQLGYFISVNSNPYFVRSAIRYPGVLFREMTTHFDENYYTVATVLDVITLNIDLSGHWKTPEGHDGWKIMTDACDNAHWRNQVSKGFPSQESLVPGLPTGVKVREVSRPATLSLAIFRTALLA